MGAENGGESHADADDAAGCDKAYQQPPYTTTRELLDPEAPGGKEREVARVDFPRQNKRDGLCIADFFRDIDSAERDVIGLQVVTMGSRASEAAREWFSGDEFDRLLLATVRSTFPSHEHEKFAEHYRGLLAASLGDR